MEHTIFAVEICARLVPESPLRAGLAHVIGDAPYEMSLHQKWTQYTRAAQLLFDNLSFADRGCWDYYNDDTRAQRDFDMWSKGMITKEGVRSAPSGNADPYRGEPRYLTLTMALLLVQDSPSCQTLRRVCDVPQADLWKPRHLRAGAARHRPRELREREGRRDVPDPAGRRLGADGAGSPAPEVRVPAEDRLSGSEIRARREARAGPVSRLRAAGIPTSSSHSPNITWCFPLSDASFTLSVFALMMVRSFTLPESATTSASNSPDSSPSASSSPTLARPWTAPDGLTVSAGALMSPSIRPFTRMGQEDVSEPLSSVPSSTRVRFAFVASFMLGSLSRSSLGPGRRTGPQDLHP